MTELQLIQVFASLGALGLITYLFIDGRLVSAKTVDRISNAQGDHIKDLKETVGKKLDKVVEVLEEIKKNGAMK